ncbi:Mut7-C RNAse domain-containing protein [Halorubrum sp. SY-15]|uniref:Mut7-C RNAse domain-containing protein n=1 Tax=Halorubrum sp. SY-15 TaxID=3402277 RepID=UPI003EBFC4C3
MTTDGRDADHAAETERPRVLVDVMCGTLVTYLRMCGYDALYALDRGIEADDELATLAAETDRTLLTRDRALAARVEDAVRLTERDVLDQLRELDAAGYAIGLADEPTRCGACNSPVERVALDAPRPSYVPADGPERHWRCRDCGQWFWKGSHWASVDERLAEAGLPGGEDDPS